MAEVADVVELSEGFVVVLFDEDVVSRLERVDLSILIAFEEFVEV